jgi:putative two-component system response regulator
MDTLTTRDTATLLVVDDNPDNVALLVELLQADYRVLAATSGQRALELARNEPAPDLILLDVLMPGMDGYTVLATLREDARTRDIPVIFITAMNTTADEELGLILGAVDYIVKPIRPVIVRARVRIHLELKRARDQLADQNAFLEKEVARRMEENQVIQGVSIHALGCLAEMRDPETSRRRCTTSARSAFPTICCSSPASSRPTSGPS